MEERSGKEYLGAYVDRQTKRRVASMAQRFGTTQTAILEWLINTAKVDANTRRELAEYTNRKPNYG